MLLLTFSAASNPVARALRIIVSLGTPLPGYTNSGDRDGDQTSEVGDVLVKHILPKLEEFEQGTVSFML